MNLRKVSETYLVDAVDQAGQPVLSRTQMFEKCRDIRLDSIVSGDIVVTGNNMIWNVSTGKIIRKLGRSAHISMQGSLVAYIDRSDLVVGLFILDTNANTAVLIPIERAPNVSAIHIYNGVLAVGYFCGDIRMYDIQTKEQKYHTEFGEGHAVNHICMRDNLVAVSMYNGNVCVIDWKQSETVLRGNMLFSGSLTMSREFLVGGGNDDHIYVWSLRSGKLLLDQKHHTRPKHIFMNDDRTLVVFSYSILTVYQCWPTAESVFALSRKWQWDGDGAMRSRMFTT